MHAAAQDPEHDTATQLTPMLPRTIADGRYLVTGQLGVGGMGVVLRARDRSLDRDVAVKLLADNLSLDEDARTRFLREARAAASISDPRVVGVYDVGEQDGRPYFVMECVDGESLAEVLATEGPLQGDLLLDIATDALAGLARAHDAGVLHRDVKPGNLLRSPDGTVKVTDFGVATAVDSDRMTRTGFVIGTAAYLAPERRRGEAATVRTDLWSLGATLTELLTGEPPGPEADERLERRRSELPPQLLRLVRHLLAPDPADRPTDALAALELLAGDPSSSHADTPPPGIPRTELLRTPSGGRVPRPTGDVVTGTNGTGSGRLRLTPTTEPGPGPDTEEHATPRRRARWPQAVLLVALLVAAAFALATLVGSGQEGTAPDEGFGPVVVDPADPAGTVRELGEQLRERAGR
jgi:eukaryotic-like serine/threonine-protein kinase